MLRNRFWQPKIEKLKPQALLRLQNRRAAAAARYAFERSGFYRRRFKESGIRPSRVKGVADLRKIPFTTKADFRENYPYGLLAVPLEDVCRVHASSGTTGDPTIVAYTERDLENWSDCIARCLTMTGVTRRDVYQVILGYGLFTGGLGFHYGAEKVGATVVPSSTGNTKRQVKLMKDLGVTAFTSIPSYTLYLMETARSLGVEPDRDLAVKSISCGAEVWSPGTRDKIEEAFGCGVFNSYGLSEVCGPGVAFECVRKSGLHVWSDHFLAEIVDPDTGDILEPEERGELVLTALTKEAMPLLRYRTRDITSILDGPCDCGRTHTRISWITGRSDDMLKIKGVNVFPSQIETAIMKVKGVGTNFLIEVTRKGFMDDLIVNVEVDRTMSHDTGSWPLLKKKVMEEIDSIIGIRVGINLQPPNSLPRIEGKANRVIDLRV